VIYFINNRLHKEAEDPIFISILKMYGGYVDRLRVFVILGILQQKTISSQL